MSEFSFRYEKLLDYCQPRMIFISGMKEKNLNGEDTGTIFHNCHVLLTVPVISVSMLIASASAS